MADTQGIMQLYTAYFNRAVDKAGVDYWAGMMDSNGWSLNDIATSFSDQTEYTDLYDGLSETQIVEKVYQNVLNRDGEADGIEYWSGELANGNISVSQLVQAVVSASTEKDENGEYVHSEDAILFNNKIELSQYCYDNDINGTGTNAISLSEITIDLDSIASLKTFADDVKATIELEIENEQNQITEDANSEESTTNTYLTTTNDLGLGVNVYLETYETWSSSEEVGEASYTYSYDSSTNLISQYALYQGNTFLSAKAEFDSNGNFILGMDYNEDEGYLDYKEEFDSNGNLILAQEYDANGNVISTETNTYDSLGRVLVHTWESTDENEYSSEDTTTYTYDDTTFTVNSSGTKSSDGTTYNVDGTGELYESGLIKMIAWDYDGDGIYSNSVHYYEYDALGNITSDKSDWDGDRVIDNTYIYEFDANGNEISDTGYGPENVLEYEDTYTWGLFY